MLTKLRSSLFLNHEAEINIGVRENALYDEGLVVEGFVVQLLRFKCDKFFEIFRNRRRHAGTRAYPLPLLRSYLLWGHCNAPKLP